MIVRPPVGILLAAGTGSRFSPDGTRNKLLEQLPDGTPVALASLRALQTVSPHVVATVHPHAHELAELLSCNGATVLRCPLATQGMGVSLAFAAAHCESRHAPALVALADMPWIRPRTIAMVANALANGNHIVAPVYDGRRGHPVGFPAGLFPQLMELRGDSGARDLLNSGNVVHLECGDPAILQDVDHPADLMREPFTSAA